MSALRFLKKYSFHLTFTSLFVGMHYGWHLLQQQSEVNRGQPPKELPATILVKYLYKRVAEIGKTDSAESAVVSPAANQQ